MHRSNFRPKPTNGYGYTEPVPVVARATPTDPVPGLIEEVKRELDDLREKLDSALRAFTENEKADVTIPADVAKSLQLVHGRLDRVENQFKEQISNTKAAQTTLANALREVTLRLDRLTDSDAKFSLAHELDALIKAMKAPKRIKRDAAGNMIGWEIA